MAFCGSRGFHDSQELTMQWCPGSSPGREAWLLLHIEVLKSHSCLLDMLWWAGNVPQPTSWYPWSQTQDTTILLFKEKKNYVFTSMFACDAKHCRNTIPRWLFKPHLAGSSWRNLNCGRKFSCKRGQLVLWAFHPLKDRRTKTEVECQGHIHCPLSPRSRWWWQNQNTHTL